MASNIRIKLIKLEIIKIIELVVITPCLSIQLAINPGIRYPIYIISALVNSVNQKLNKTKLSLWLVGNNSKLRALGWKPKISLDQGIKETLEYFKSEKTS